MPGVLDDITQPGAADTSFAEQQRRAAHGAGARTMLSHDGVMVGGVEGAAAWQAAMTFRSRTAVLDAAGLGPSRTGEVVREG